MVKSAIRTDFILSAEIMVISLNEVADDGIRILDEHTAEITTQLQALRDVTDAIADEEAQSETNRAELEERGEIPRGLPRPFEAWAGLRSRIESGVTSTHSSSRMNSSACSSESGRGGISRTSSSEVEARMFVSFFSLVAFTSMSSERAFSPTIIPS